MLQELYEDRYGELDIQIEEIGLANDDSQKHSAITRIRTQLMAGEGPDIIVFQIPAYEDPYALLQDVSKAMRAGAFLDVLPYLEQLDAWQPEACQPAVLKAGTWNGGLYLLPLYYDIPLVQASAAHPPAEDAPIWRADRCDEWLAWSAAQSPAGLRFNTGAGALWQALDVSLLDYDNDQVNFDDPAVVRVAQYHWELSKVLSQKQWLPAETAQVERVRVSVLQYLNVEDPFFAWNLYPLRSESGGVNATVTVAAVVSAGCEHPELAARLLTILLEPEAQAGVPSPWVDNVGNDTSIGPLLNVTERHFPLRTEAIRLWAEHTKDVVEQFVAEQCAEIAGEVTGARLNQIVYLEANDFLTQAHNAGLTFEEAMADLDARWTRYVSE